MSDPETDDLYEQRAIATPGFYFSGEDALQLTSWNALAGVALTVTGRFIHADGRVEPFSETHTPNTNRTAKTAFYNRGVGWLTDLSIIVTGATPLRGQTYVRVDVVRGSPATSIVLSTLLQGYVTATKRVAYPGSPLEDSLAGQGAIRSITGTDQPAGTELSETVPTGARWRLSTLFVTLVTSAVAGTRTVRVILDDGTSAYFEIPALEDQAPSNTQRYTLAALGFGGATGKTFVSVPVPMPAILAAGHRIRTSTASFDAGDNWGAPQYEVEEWLEAI